MRMVKSLRRTAVRVMASSARADEEEAALIEAPALPSNLLARQVRAARHTIALVRGHVARCVAFIGLPSAEECIVSIIRFMLYLSLLMGADYLAHKTGALDRDGPLLASDVASMARYYWTGVYATESSDLDAEAQEFAMHLHLRPGMTICEMGSADGSLMVRVGKHVMPGGRLVATAPKRAELAATSKAAKAAGLGPVRTHLATNADWAPGLEPHTCDAIYSRMVIHMVDITVIRR